MIRQHNTAKLLRADVAQSNVSQTQMVSRCFLFFLSPSLKKKNVIFVTLHSVVHRLGKDIVVQLSLSLRIILVQFSLSSRCCLGTVFFMFVVLCYVNVLAHKCFWKTYCDIHPSTKAPFLIQNAQYNCMFFSIFPALVFYFLNSFQGQNWADNLMDGWSCVAEKDS